jgi:hypothetical protein
MTALAEALFILEHQIEAGLGAAKMYEREKARADAWEEQRNAEHEAWAQEKARADEWEKAAKEDPVVVGRRFEKRLTAEKARAAELRRIATLAEQKQFEAERDSLEQKARAEEAEANCDVQFRGAARVQRIRAEAAEARADKAEAMLEAAWADRNCGFWSGEWSFDKWLADLARRTGGTA